MLFQRLQELFGVSKEFLELDEIALQQRYAAALRTAAINHLRHGKEITAKSFRGEYVASGLGDYQSFLNKQAGDTVWGTYIEATALAEKIGCTLVVTPVSNGKQQKPICLYRPANASAPTIELLNSNNTHWYVNDKTKGDGNCLYNAFAQALQKKAQQERPAAQSIATAPTTITPAAATAIPTIRPLFFHQNQDNNQNHNTTVELQVIQHQQEIVAAIQKKPTSNELEQYFKSQSAYMASLNQNDRQQVEKQIRDDYQLALKLAREEMDLSSISINVCEPRRSALQPVEASSFTASRPFSV